MNIQNLIYIFLLCFALCFFRQNALVWHNRVILEDEIWINVGGDNGGSTFKLAFQIVDTKHPNSLRNTIVFAWSEAPD